MAPTVPVHPTDLARWRTEHPDMRVIDVRTPGEFAARHIPGSYNVPLPDLAEHRDELTGADDADAPVVLVCESGRRAGTAESQLAAAGLAAVHVLDGGVAAWERDGFPLSHAAAGNAPWALERQVRLAAGGAVAASVAASLAWRPAALVAGAVGAGLVAAAVTDSCALGALLSRLPYNRRRVQGCDLPGVVATLTQPEEVTA